MKIIRINPNKTKVTNFLVFILSIFSFLFLVFSFSVDAVSPSPEPSPTETEELNEKIQDIREAVKEKVQEKLADVNKGQKKAFVGEINEITNLTLILTTREGEKQAKVNEEAKIINLNRKEVAIKDLEIGSYVIAMGYLEETDILDVIRVVVTEKPEPTNREVALGKVTDISEEKVLTVKNDRQGTTYTIETTSKTVVSKKTEEKMEKLNFSEIELNDFLVVIGTPSENEEKIITAKLIHVIPASPAGGPAEKPETAEPTPSTSPTEETEE